MLPVSFVEEDQVCRLLSKQSMTLEIVSETDNALLVCSVVNKLETRLIHCVKQEHLDLVLVYQLVDPVILVRLVYTKV